MSTSNFRTRCCSVVFLAMGSVLATAQETFVKVTGDRPDHLFGSSVDGVGDVNGDGVSDFVVGIIWADPVGDASGMVRVFSGADGAMIHQVAGPRPGAQLGNSVSAAGDVDHDGFPDVILGAFGDGTASAAAGSARIHSGRTGRELRAFFGESADDQLGYSVSGAGDVDLDGFDDQIVGARFDKGRMSTTGSVFVYSGANGSTLHSLHSSSPGSLFGHSVGRAGDVNRDGYADVLVGDIRDNALFFFGGSAFVFSGFDSRLLHAFYGDSANDRFGETVAGVGDINGDGYGDVMVGAPGDASAGTVRVFSGRSGDVLHAFFGETGTFDYFGLGGAIAGVGDLNHDGFGDILLGAERTGLDPTFSFIPGAVFAHSGRDGSLLFKRSGAKHNDFLGSSVGAIGDVNGDGRADVVVGADVAGFVEVVSGSQCQEDLGFGGPGMVTLSACGDDLTISGNQATLRLDGATPGASVWIVVGTSANPMPFLGGVLVPNPVFASLGGLVADASGNLSLPILGAGGSTVTAVAQAIVIGSSVEFSNALAIEIGTQ